jgi:RimJ/RimL family protein N-acetyltransferase
VEIQRVTEEHREALIRFVGGVPASDRNFFKEDIGDPEIVQHWIRARGVRLIAIDETNEVVATVAVLPRVGWSDHVGELELIVGPGHRGSGLGRSLAKRGLLEAVELGLTHIVVEVAAEQDALVAMFERLGFEPEALLRDFVRDRRGECHDLLMLTHRTEETWSEMLTLGIDEAVNG